MPPDYSAPDQGGDARILRKRSHCATTQAKTPTLRACRGLLRFSLSKLHTLKAVGEATFRSRIRSLMRRKYYTRTKTGNGKLRHRARFAPGAAILHN